MSTLTQYTNRDTGHERKIGRKKQQIKRVCLNCGKEFFITPTRKDTAKFCSRRCAGQQSKSKFKVGHKMFRSIESYGEEFKKKLRESHNPKSDLNLTYRHPKGEPTWNKGLIGWKNGGSFKEGENHWNWKGGVFTAMMGLRYDKRYKQWRRRVKKRDNYVCQHCGSEERLEAHHRLPFSEYPDLMFDVTNGITLCRKCHMKLHPHLSKKICQL